MRRVGAVSLSRKPRHSGVFSQPTSRAGSDKWGSPALPAQTTAEGLDLMSFRTTV